MDASVWKQGSPYGQPHDWLFASPHTRGRTHNWAEPRGGTPYWPDILLSRVIRPAAARAGIRKDIGWHTFRHSFSSMLMANGENVKVVQELMRHANCRCTLEIYSQARIQAKQEAQRRVVEMILPRNREATEVEEPLILAKQEAAVRLLLYNSNARKTVIVRLAR
jgi:integrase